MQNIKLIQGDITKSTADAIVNAANSIMLGGGGVDGAIHAAAGPKLLEECKKVSAINGMRCPVGQARITGAGDLQSKYVIHTVGPRYKIDPNPEKLLTSAYESSLKLALENSCQSVAFPAISCGIFGYPLDEAARVAYSVCGQNQFANLEITFYLFGDEAFSVWLQILKNWR
jgi:O-acetyl-ADP-ribose deacetylase (regulator of RNase III)